MMLTLFREVGAATLMLVASAAVGLFGLLGLATGWWSLESDTGTANEPPPPVVLGAQGVDGPTITPVPDADPPTVTPTPPPPTPTSEPPTPTPTPPPDATATPIPEVLGAEETPFEGRWRITDTVTQGSNVGEAFSFEVTLEQRGSELTGRGPQIELSGEVQDQTAIVEYVQPALGAQGTFVWTLTGPDDARGTFTNSNPNSGSSRLERLD